MNGVILAAGKGTRMRPLTLKRPKPLVPILDLPMIEHIIKGMATAGVDRVCIVVGYMEQMIRDRLGDGSRLGVEMHYCVQEKAGGTGDAVLHAADFIGDQHFFLSWGDIMVAPPNYGAVADLFTSGGCDGVLSANWVDDPYEGAAVYQVDGCLSDIIEKPEKGASSSNHNNAGIFILPPQMIDVLRAVPLSPRGEIEMTSALLQFAADGGRLAVHEITGYWDDVARPANVIALQATMLRQLSQDGLLVARSAEVAEDAILHPPVYIGCDARVESGTIGPNAVIGAGCSVLEGSHISDTTLFGSATLGANVTAQYAIFETGAHAATDASYIGDEAEPVYIDAE